MSTESSAFHNHSSSALTSIALPIIVLILRITKNFFSSAVKPAQQRRNEILIEIYDKASTGLKRDSLEYDRLAESGMTWENHFRPGRLEPYLAIQTKLSKTLASIQKQRSVLDSMKDGSRRMKRALVNAYAHQSVAIAHNSLKISDTIMIDEKLDQSLRHLDLPQVDLKDLSRLQLPTSNEMFPS